MFHRRFYIIMTVLLLAAVLICSTGYSRNETVVRGYSSVSISDKWQKLIDDDPGRVLLRDETPETVVELPVRFSFMENGRIPEVLDQGSSGTCWAYAALTALETSLLPEEAHTFSRAHLLQMNSFDTDEELGGESSMALAYLLAWQGPVEEPWNGSDSARIAKHVQGAVVMEDPSTEEIKKAVYLYGGVEASVYLVMSDSDHLIEVDHYYNVEEKAYCYTGDRRVNHDVVIIGWDDEYSRNNFVNGDMLYEDGAFLCLNSWGEEFGENGTFWISYCDAALASRGMYFSDVESRSNYDHIYQTDLCGATANAGYGSETAYFANAYTAQSHETLAAVGFYTLGKNSTYEVYGVQEFRGAASLENRVLLASGALPDAGYFTIPLDGYYPLAEGDTFAVVVRLSTPGLSCPVAVEKATKDIPGVVTDDGEGYLSNDGIYFRNTENQSGCNICLKVYTRDQEAANIRKSRYSKN